MNQTGKDATERARRTKVALLVGKWLPASETFIYDQLRHQRRTQIQVLARERTRYAERFPYDDVTCLGPLEQVLFYHCGISPQVRRQLTRRPPEVIHAHFGVNGAMIVPLAKAFNIPLVVSFHGHDIGGLAPKNRRTVRYFQYQRRASRLFSYASRFLCASTELVELLVGFGAPTKKVFLHHLGVDVDQFTPRFDQRESQRILAVGRLVEKKGLRYALAAFASISVRHPAARLVIVGEGPLEKALRTQTRDLGIERKVEFLGALSRADVLGEMRKASIMLTPSITTESGDRESGVIVLKEAGATGLPSVATRHGGIPEIIEHEHTGLLVAERNPEELATAIEALLDNPTRAQRMGEAAQNLIRTRYDARVQNHRLEQHLLEVSQIRCNSG
jgi:colanic acid/amylovoran biosynthesis glycosyltransferase